MLPVKETWVFFRQNLSLGLSLKILLIIIRMIDGGDKLSPKFAHSSPFTSH